MVTQAVASGWVLDSVLEMVLVEELVEE